MLSKEEFLFLVEKLYCFPLSRNEDTCKNTNNFFVEAMSDENFEILKVTEYETTFKTSKGTYETWTANANYACLTGVRGIKGTCFNLSSGMPCRWTVKEFMKLVNDFKKSKKG